MVIFNMLDISPLSEYELYMRNFGSEDTRQVQRIVLQYEVFCEVLVAMGM